MLPNHSNKAFRSTSIHAQLDWLWHGSQVPINEIKLNIAESMDLQKSVIYKFEQACDNPPRNRFSFKMDVSDQTI